MAIRERLCIQEPDFNVTDFLKSCQDGTNTLVWWGIMHKNKGTSLE